MEQKEFDIEEIRKVREEEMNQLSEKLEKGVEEFLSSDRYREYLGYMQKFHNYSFSNIILIAVQRPDATLVAGYDSWKRKGRHVKKGEKGIRIIAPVEITVKEKAEAEDNLEGVQGKKEQEAEERKKPGEKITYEKLVFLKQAVDESVMESRNMQEFVQAMRRRGYAMQTDPHRKYWTALPKGSRRPIRVARLGEEYTNQEIIARAQRERSCRWSFIGGGDIIC